MTFKKRPALFIKKKLSNISLKMFFIITYI
jgi:hypothetical protein